jgi:hypothetical protein
MNTKKILLMRSLIPVFSSKQLKCIAQDAKCYNVSSRVLPYLQLLVWELLIDILLKLDQNARTHKITQQKLMLQLDQEPWIQTISSFLPVHDHDLYTISENPINIINQKKSNLYHKQNFNIRGSIQHFTKYVNDYCEYLDILFTSNASQKLQFILETWIKMIFILSQKIYLHMKSFKIKKKHISIAVLYSKTPIRYIPISSTEFKSFDTKVTEMFGICENVCDLKYAKNKRVTVDAIQAFMSIRSNFRLSELLYKTITNQLPDPINVKQEKSI